MPQGARLPVGARHRAADWR
jgi:hypothetical protein